ncbi:hypothetical protein LC092_07565 [Stappia stellulata]|uniref:hypothetical protein n=1 Tax=Stappia stellulata TaxID=71235 RepID=UPI001CD301D6|nr:hypothetical protein [Stappia stellulata]MCA1242291.1 hypothetical protein [Stappia stellulata]
MRSASFGLLFCLVFSGEADALGAGTAPDASGLLDPITMGKMIDLVGHDVVQLMVSNQNRKYESLQEDEIKLLDEQWVQERARTDQPLVAATLSNPLSAYLTRIQAESRGAILEIIVMDRYGLNVGQSQITSDYWQGDEAKFQKTFLVGTDAVFVDEAEWNSEYGIWHTQLNFTLSHPETGQPIGAATIEVNLTELTRRQQFAQ